MKGALKASPLKALPPKFEEPAKFKVVTNQI